VDWLLYATQWLHVLLGIFWFGTVLSTNTIFIPVLNRLPLDRQREIGGAYGELAARILTPVAIGVIVLGIVRGTLLGPIKSLDLLTTTYGITWLVALAAAILTFTWGERVIKPAIQRMNAIEPARALLPDGSPSPEMNQSIGFVKRVAALELLGFFVIFSCMILMRFGL
jgi:hypothetical protein